MENIKADYHIVRNRQELEGVLGLVYKEYVQRGYITKDYKSKLRIAIYNALPSTTTFVAKQNRRVLAGVTLIPDSKLGLPMDKIYKDELDKLRKKGRRVSEVSQLSIDTSIFGKGFFAMFNFNKLIFVFRLFKLVLDYARDYDKLTDLCIAINPKQQYLYRFLTFEQIGGLKYYGSVNRAPAIAMRLSLEGLEERTSSRKGLFKIFLGQTSPAQVFKGKLKLNRNDLEALFVKKSDIFKKADKTQLSYLEHCYSGVKIEKLIRR